MLSLPLLFLAEAKVVGPTSQV